MAQALFPGGFVAEVAHGLSAMSAGPSRGRQDGPDRGGSRIRRAPGEPEFDPTDLDGRGPWMRFQQERKYGRAAV